MGPHGHLIEVVAAALLIDVAAVLFGLYVVLNHRRGRPTPSDERVVVFATCVVLAVLASALVVSEGVEHSHPEVPVRVRHGM